MTAAFSVVAALLVVAALAFVLPALLARGRRTARVAVDSTNIAIYRDQLKELDADLAAGTLGRAQHEEARREIERRILEDVRVGSDAAPAAPSGSGAATAVGIAIPLVAGLLYLAVGAPQALSPRPEAGDGHDVTIQQIEGMVDRLAARLKESPDDIKGWVMLGRSYSVLNRFPEAVAAFESAIRRSPPDAQLLADYADALAMTQGQNLMGAPEKIIAQALQVDPDNVKALALAGTIAFQKQDFKGALVHWERALKIVPPDSGMADNLRDSIADAQKVAGPGTAPDAAPRQSASAPATVAGTVSLAPSLASKAAPDDTVFIFARPVEGPRMPLAVLRKRVRDLPTAFTLDDSMAMTPAARLSNYGQVVVGARVSKSGNPVAKPGDLEGLSAPVRTGDNQVAITISAEVR